MIENQLIVNRLQLALGHNKAVIEFASRKNKMKRRRIKTDLNYLSHKQALTGTNSLTSQMKFRMNQNSQDSIHLDRKYWYLGKK